MTLSWHFLDACHLKVHDNPRDLSVCYRILRWWKHHTELPKSLAGHAGTLWQWRVSNSHVLGLHPFAAHLTDPSGVVEVEQVAIWKVWNYRNEGTPKMLICLSSISFDKQYDCWFMYVFSMMTAQHIRNYKKNQHIWNSLAPRMPGGLRPPSVSVVFSVHRTSWELRSYGPVEEITSPRLRWTSCPSCSMRVPRQMNLSNENGKLLNCWPVGCFFQHRMEAKWCCLSCCQQHCCKQLVYVCLGWLYFTKVSKRKRRPKKEPKETPARQLAGCGQLACCHSMVL